MHSAWSQRLVQHTNPMALLTSAELNKSELPAAHDVGRHAAECCKASPQLNACSCDTCFRWRRRLASHPLIGSLRELQCHRCSCLARWPGVGQEAVAKKGHDEEVPWAAGFRQEAGMAMGCSMG